MVSKHAGPAPDPGPYRAARVALLGATAAFLCLAVYASFFSPSFVHYDWLPVRHYLIPMKYVGGWATYGAFLCWVGSRYCRARATTGVAASDDQILFMLARISIILGWLFAGTFALLIAAA